MTNDYCLCHTESQLIYAAEPNHAERCQVKKQIEKILMIGMSENLRNSCLKNVLMLNFR